MKMSTGNSSASATTDRMRSIPLALVPTSSRQLSAPQLLGAVPAMLVIFSAPRTRESRPAVWPMMMMRVFGAGSAAGPMVPIWRPGKRSPSWLAGVERSSRASAGEA
jgi:hypothetical protein